jgi:hypothetical protein
MKTKTNVEALAVALSSAQSAERSGNTEWQERHNETIARIMRNAPSGAGIDNGTKLQSFTVDHRNKPDRIVFAVDYHRMNVDGYYCGWRTYTVRIVPSFVGGFTVTVSGRDNGDGTKDYLTDVYAQWASEEYNDAQA